MICFVSNFYCLKIEKCFRDKRLVSQLSNELHIFKLTNDAIYKLRVLVGLVRFGNLDEGHFFAVFWNVKEDEVKLGIKSLFENNFIFKETQFSLLQHFDDYLQKKNGVTELMMTYRSLGLDFCKIFYRCLVE